MTHFYRSYVVHQMEKTFDYLDKMGKFLENATFEN